MSIDWNENSSAVVFGKIGKGLYVYNMTSNSTSQYYSTGYTIHALDWSPNDKYIAFNK